MHAERLREIAESPSAVCGDIDREVLINAAAELDRMKEQQRRFLPSLSDLVDRLTIVQMKAVFIPEHKAAYMEEMALIEHDIDLLLDACTQKVNASAIRAIIVIMLTNRFIWENESKAREGGDEQDKLLKLTHTVNGIRNGAKNKLAYVMGGRLDYKLDCLAASLDPKFGNWAVFEDD